jgi:hypothetical protein
LCKKARAIKLVQKNTKLRSAPKFITAPHVPRKSDWRKESI